jgi:hypothetical protein
LFTAYVIVVIRKRVKKKKKGLEIMENKREKFVKMVVRQESNNVIGGYDNSLLDGEIEVMPSKDELVSEIYFNVMRADVLETRMGLVKVKEDIRFVGTARIMEMVTNLVNKEVN